MATRPDPTWTDLQSSQQWAARLTPTIKVGQRRWSLWQQRYNWKHRSVDLRLMKFLQRKRVCVQPPPSAVNVTLPAFDAKRQLLQHDACSDRSASPARRALSSKQTCRRGCCRSMGQTDGRTDARPLRDPAPHSMRATSISKTKQVQTQET